MADLRYFVVYLAVWFASDLTAYYARFGQITARMSLTIPLCQAIALAGLFVWKDARRQRATDLVAIVVVGSLLGLTDSLFSQSDFSRLFFALQLVMGILALLATQRVLKWAAEGGITSQK